MTFLSVTIENAAEMYYNRSDIAAAHLSYSQAAAVKKGT